MIFVIFKLFHLNVSFFWDESWVYAPAIRSMAEIGPSLLPDSIPLDYSRGHPLLFHFLGSSWILIFGSGFFSMHFFALTITIGFLFTAVALLKTFENDQVTFWVTLLLCIQPLFVAQASIVLPEMLLATLTLCSIYFYVKGRTLLYICFGVLTILTKETGILIIGAIALYDFIKNIAEKRSFIEIIKSGFIYICPILALVAHMIYLKAVFGWYLYPEHTGLIKSDINRVIIAFSSTIKDQVWNQWRFLITVPFILLYGYHIVLKKNFASIVFIIISILISLYFNTFYGNHFVITVLYILFAGHFAIERFIKGKEREKIILLFFIFIIIYCLFSAANFYTVRYLLSTFLYILFIPIYFLLTDSVFKKYIPYLFIVFVPLFIFELLNPKAVNDVNLSYLSYCPLQMEAVEFLEENEWYKERINTKFLMYIALTDDKAGYRKTSETFENVNGGKESREAIYIFNNVELDERRDNFNGDLLKRFEMNHVWFEIWKEKE
ncbi:ArnT family glycosyltransferase [Portibacter lacus]|nr:glycosyltransferase family 39 protein [Portibacter lacus]